MNELFNWMQENSGGSGIFILELKPAETIPEEISSYLYHTDRHTGVGPFFYLFGRSYRIKTDKVTEYALINSRISVAYHRNYEFPVFLRQNDELFRITKIRRATDNEIKTQDEGKI